MLLPVWIDSTPDQSDEFFFQGNWDGLDLRLFQVFKIILKCHKVDLLKRSWKNSDGRKVFICFLHQKDFISHCLSSYILYIFVFKK